tara:strand:+ start:162 stop:848 length:687 start_codon:yes stop_codon:yes gene_type:complete
MVDVSVSAAFQLNTGEVVDCITTMTEGTAAELVLSTAYSVSAVSVGTYAEGKVITQILQAPSAPNGIAWAYVNRRGSIICVLPVSIDGVASQPCPMPFQFTLQAGDTIQVMCNSAADREFSYSCITNTGVHAIFSGTPADSSGAQLTHILSGQGLGASLTNSRIVSHWATSVDGALLTSGSGLFILNDRGLPIGGTIATNPINLQAKANSMGTCGIGLNFVAQVSTSA